ncbi:Glu-tRNA(Gln) amidotransferase subunit GatD [Candidatus Woesearchaeota archaeon]|nr:Glu-tRNA(Gln) amidotransferase subunit GatD [Candidatus Woesearchaeota archaeon]
MQKANPGDKVKVLIDSQELEGIFIPSPNNTFVLKLKSGYNIGIDKKKIKKIEVLQKFKTSELKLSKVQHNKDLKAISILHTGGTVASSVSYETGGVIARFTPEEILTMFPELQKIANINSRLISNMFSEDMNFNHYNIIAKEIEKELKNGVDGIIITHGTDTLGFTAAALTFILENLPIPVILVGSQRSSDRGSTDAKLNLLSAAQFIAKTDFQGVAICMHESMNDDSCLIMPSLKTRKMHSSARNAFKVVNDNAIARVDQNGNITFLKQHPKKEEKKLTLKLFNPKLKIGILKAHPNMSAKEISNYSSFDGLILEGYGLAGNFPINKIDKFTSENEKIYNELKKLAKKNPLVATSQTIYGRVNMNVYSTGRLLQEAGITGHNLDVLTETAFIKLAWLLSNYPKNRIKELFNENLRGEISKRTEPDFADN